MVAELSLGILTLYFIYRSHFGFSYQVFLPSLDANFLVFLMVS